MIAINYDIVWAVALLLVLLVNAQDNIDRLFSTINITMRDIVVCSAFSFDNCMI